MLALLVLVERFLKDPYDGKVLKHLALSLGSSRAGRVLCAAQRAWWRRRGVVPAVTIWRVDDLRAARRGSAPEALVEWAKVNDVDLEQTRILLEQIEALGCAELAQLIVLHDLVHVVLGADTGQGGELRVIGAQIGAGSPDMLAWGWLALMPLLVERSPSRARALRAFLGGVKEGLQRPELARLAQKDWRQATIAALGGWG